MRIALISEVFSKRMGYLENVLPKYLARQGAEVHLITTDLPPYHHLKDFHATYDGFAGHGELAPGTIESYQGFSLHVLPHRKAFGYMRMVGLRDKLAILDPDIVQATTAIGWNALSSALYQPRPATSYLQGLIWHPPFSVLLARNLPGGTLSGFSA